MTPPRLAGDVIRAARNSGFDWHFCLGAPLARMEGVVGFETLLSRLANIEVAPARNDFTDTPSFILRGLKHLHLTFDRA